MRIYLIHRDFLVLVRGSLKRKYSVYGLSHVNAAKIDLYREFTFFRTSQIKVECRSLKKRRFEKRLRVARYSLIRSYFSIVKSRS
jgi:hypothetical protein